MFIFDWSYRHCRWFIKIIINMSKYLNDQSVFQRMLSKTLDLMENLFTDGRRTKTGVYVSRCLRRMGVVVNWSRSYMKVTTKLTLRYFLHLEMLCPFQEYCRSSFLIYFYKTKKTLSSQSYQANHCGLNRVSFWSHLQNWANDDQKQRSELISTFCCQY